MQMAIICGAIANGGKATNPTLIKDESILSALGINYKSSGQELFHPIRRQSLMML